MSAAQRRRVQRVECPACGLRVSISEVPSTSLTPAHRCYQAHNAAGVFGGLACRLSAAPVGDELEVLRLAALTYRDVLMADRRLDREQATLRVVAMVERVLYG